MLRTVTAGASCRKSGLPIRAPPTLCGAPRTAPVPRASALTVRCKLPCSAGATPSSATLLRRSGGYCLRPAAAARRSAPGGAVKVVAFRDSNRAQQLLESAAEFVGHWMQGRVEGPTEPVLRELGQVCDDSIEVEYHGLMGHTKDKGSEGLARQLSKLRELPSGDGARLSARSWSTTMCAANEEDIVFCLMQLQGEDDTGQPWSCYELMKLDFLVDETARRVTHVVERGQWGAAAEGMAALLMEQGSARQAPGMLRDQDEAREGKEPAGGRRGGGGMVLGPDLPVDRINHQSQTARFLKGQEPEQLRGVIQAWCVARCSGQDERALLRDMLAPDFQVWDAYGLLHLAAPDQDIGPVMQRSAVLDMIQGWKAEHVVDVVLLDCATSYVHNVAFSHWRAALQPRGAGAAMAANAAQPGGGSSNGEIIIEGMELDIFNQQGQLSDVWVFRDPLEHEKVALERAARNAKCME